MPKSCFLGWHGLVFYSHILGILGSPIKLNHHHSNNNYKQSLGGNCPPVMVICGQILLKDKGTKWISHQRIMFRTEIKNREGVWILRRKIHLTWTPTRNLSAKMDTPWSTEGPKFMNNKNIAAICWQGLLMYSLHWVEAHTGFSASFPVPACLHHLSLPLSSFRLSTNGWELPHPNRTIQTVSLFAFILTNQNCMNWDTSFT